jgi:hypothetical protein
MTLKHVASMRLRPPVTIGTINIVYEGPSFNEAMIEEENELAHATGLVSRVSPVHTAMRNCTRDEGGPFEVGNQVLI